MSISSLSNTELKALRRIIANHLETMTCGALSADTVGRLWLNPPSSWNGWEFSVSSHFGPADTIATWVAPARKGGGAVLLCDLLEHKDEPSLLNRKVAEAKANLKAAGLLAAGSKFVA